MQELENAPGVTIAPVERLAASDGIQLALRSYVPKSPVAGVVFYHGGGAHSAAGYQYLASALRDKYNIAVFTPDIRGHGQSGGPRGDAPTPKQVLEDVATLLGHLRARYPHLPLCLGGHSSGAGMVLNFATSKYREPVSDYLFLAPHLGFRSKTEREDIPHPFSDVTTADFVINGMTGGLLLGHAKAVRFAYSPELLESDPGMVAYNTVNMANALTPRSPGNQLRALSAPLAVWIGAEDELLDPAKVVSFVEEWNPSAYVDEVQGAKHLSVLLEAADLMGPWILKKRGRDRVGDDSADTVPPK